MCKNAIYVVFTRCNKIDSLKTIEKTKAYFVKLGSERIELVDRKQLL